MNYKKYSMNDASIMVPEAWHEQTIHIFSSEAGMKPGISLVVIKEPLEKGKKSDAYKNMALERLPTELPGFTLLKETQMKLYGGRMEVYLLEHEWKSEHGLMHHFQAVYTITRDVGILKTATMGYSITMSMMKALYKPEYETTIKDIVRSFSLQK